MFGLGAPELIVILIVALIVIGPAKIPELARSLGKLYFDLTRYMSEAKSSLRDLDFSDDIKTVRREAEDAINVTPRENRRAREVSSTGSVGSNTEKDQETEARGLDAALSFDEGQDDEPPAPDMNAPDPYPPDPIERNSSNNPTRNEGER